MATGAKSQPQARSEVRFPGEVMDRVDLLVDSVMSGILEGARERARKRGAGSKVTRVAEADVLQAAIATLQTTIPKLEQLLTQCEGRHVRVRHAS